MKECINIHDITRDLFKAPVYPGDDAPRVIPINSTLNGDKYNKCDLMMTSHSGTHIDAPLHFIHRGTAVDQMELASFVGPCTVWEPRGALTLQELTPVLAGSPKRLLIKGDVVVSEEISQAIAASGVVLLGIEGLTVGQIESPMSAHLVLLSRDVAILESLDLSGVAPGGYFLCAAPLKLGGLDGAPCRAILIEF